MRHILSITLEECNNIFTKIFAINLEFSLCVLSLLFSENVGFCTVNFSELSEALCQFLADRTII